MNASRMDIMNPGDDGQATLNYLLNQPDLYMGLWINPKNVVKD